MILEGFNISFRSIPDTEVLFYHLIYFGIKNLKKLNGMYTFAFFDQEKKKLFYVETDWE